MVHMVHHASILEDAVALALVKGNHFLLFVFASLKYPSSI
jgi:hypothetical protein